MPEYFQFWWISLVLTSTAGRTVAPMIHARTMEDVSQDVAPKSFPSQTTWPNATMRAGSKDARQGMSGFLPQNVPRQVR